MGTALFPTYLKPVFLIAVLLLPFPSLVRADEIWISPGQGAGSPVGNWGTAKLGGLFLLNKETHFSFHVPDNYDEAATQPDGRALIVIIPPRTSTLDYTVKLNVVRVGESHTTNPVSFSSTQFVSKNQLTEIDVTSLIPALIPSDYVTINLELRGFNEKTQVVGMRFQYVSQYVTVSTEEIADQSVTGDKVADSAVDRRKLADEAVDSGKLAARAVEAEKIADNAVIRDKIAVEAVDSSRLAARAVEAEKIADNAVIRDKIAVEAVDSSRLAARAVEAEKIADKAVLRDKIAVEAVDSSRLAAKAVEAEKIADQAVISEKIADKAVVSSKIADNAIDSSKLAVGSVDSTKIAVNAIDSSKIAVNAVDRTKIAPKAIDSSKIADKAVGTANIADNAVDASKIADGAVRSIALGSNLTEEGCTSPGELEQTIISVECTCDNTEVAWAGRCTHASPSQSDNPTLQAGGLFFNSEREPPAWVWQCVWSKAESADYDFTAHVICLK